MSRGNFNTQNTRPPDWLVLAYKSNHYYNRHKSIFYNRNKNNSVTNNSNLNSPGEAFGVGRKRMIGPPPGFDAIVNCKAPISQETALAKADAASDVPQPEVSTFPFSVEQLETGTNQGNAGQEAAVYPTTALHQPVVAQPGTVLHQPVVAQPGTVLHQPVVAQPGTVLHQPVVAQPGTVLHQPVVAQPGTVLHQPVVAQPGTVLHQPGTILHQVNIAQPVSASHQAFVVQPGTAAYPRQPESAEHVASVVQPVAVAHHSFVVQPGGAAYQALHAHRPFLAQPAPAIFQPIGIYPQNSGCAVTISNEQARFPIYTGNNSQLMRMEGGFTQPTEFFGQGMPSQYPHSPRFAMGPSLPQPFSPPLEAPTIYYPLPYNTRQPMLIHPTVTSSHTFLPTEGRMPFSGGRYSLPPPPYPPPPPPPVSPYFTRSPPPPTTGNLSRFPVPHFQVPMSMPCFRPCDGRAGPENRSPQPLGYPAYTQPPSYPSTAAVPPIPPPHSAIPASAALHKSNPTIVANAPFPPTSASSAAKLSQNRTRASSPLRPIQGITTESIVNESPLADPTADIVNKPNSVSFPKPVAVIKPAPDKEPQEKMGMCPRGGGLGKVVSAGGDFCAGQLTPKAAGNGREVFEAGWGLCGGGTVDDGGELRFLGEQMFGFSDDSLSSEDNEVKVKQQDFDADIAGAMENVNIVEEENEEWRPDKSDDEDWDEQWQEDEKEEPYRAEKPTAEWRCSKITPPRSGCANKTQGVGGGRGKPIWVPLNSSSHGGKLADINNLDDRIPFDNDDFPDLGKTKQLRL